MNATNRLLRQAHRAVPTVHFRALDDKQGRFQARVMHYDVVDDYRTLFAPGLFRESLEARLPRVVWAHDWAEPLGRYIDYDDTATHLDLIGEFDDFDDVPRARQAYAQLKSGTIDEFSVGFMPMDGEEVMIDEEYYFRFTRARLDEVSLVLAGAVPNTKLLALRQSEMSLVRSPVLTVPKDFAAQTILDLHSGKLDIADALQQIKTVAAVEEIEDPEPKAEDSTDEETTDGEGELATEGADSTDAGTADGDDAADGVGVELGDEGSAGDGELTDLLSADTTDDLEEIDFSDLADVDSILANW